MILSNGTHGSNSELQFEPVLIKTWTELHDLILQGKCIVGVAKNFVFEDVDPDYDLAAIEEQLEHA